MEVTPELIEKVWPLTDVSVGDPLKEAAGNRKVFSVNAKEGKFIAKTTDEYKKREPLIHGLRAFELLPQKGFTHIPKLLKPRPGELFYEENGKFLYLIEYIDGKQPEASTVTYTKLASLAADLHAVQDYPYQTEFDPNTIIAKDLRTLVEDKPYQNEYLSILDSLPDFTVLPKSVIHTDLAPVNSVERLNGEIVLIDLDDIGVGIRVLDIAFPLIQQFVTEDCEFHDDQAQAFYKTYRSKIELTDVELDMVFPAALFIAMMYIVYGEQEKRWKRILWALMNQSKLEQVFRG